MPPTLPPHDDQRRRRFRPGAFTLATTLVAVSYLGRRIGAQTLSPPVTTAASSSSSAIFGSANFITIYSNDDLIVVHPIQSTVLLICVIVSSTVIEYLFERVSSDRNIYVQTIALAAKEEIVGIAFAEMLLVLLAVSVNFASDWRTNILFVALLLVYMTFGLLGYFVFLAFRIKALLQQWRDFEWARIENDSEHNTSERTFKLAKQVFMSLLPDALTDAIASRMQGGDEMRMLAESGQATQDGIDSQLLLMFFSSYTARTCKMQLRDVTDITPMTWLGLGFFVILNGLRAVTVSSIPGSSSLAHVLSYIGCIGFVPLAVLLAAYGIVNRRISSFVLKVASQDDIADRAAAQAEASRCLLFGSCVRTMQIVKIVSLTQVWYICMFGVGFSYVIFRDISWYALLIYVFAIIPPIVCALIIPHFIHLTFMGGSLSEHFDVAAIKKMFDGTIDPNDDEIEDDDDDALDDMVDESKLASRSSGNPNLAVSRSIGSGVDDDDHAGAAGGQDVSAKRRRNAANGGGDSNGRGNKATFDDEWEGEEIRLNAKSTAASSDPRRNLAPPDISVSTQFVVRQPRPVFDDGPKVKSLTALL
jgi:hypothetical protein